VFSISLLCVFKVGEKLKKYISTNHSRKEDFTDLEKKGIKLMRSNFHNFLLFFFCNRFFEKESRLDILINNAGSFAMPYTKTTDGLEFTIGVNHFGHFLLTNLLLPLIKVKLIFS
jgi:NAD(P)-dependent dehydrogenase (short-subunit alcohol dehydrogenase family)